MSGRNVSSPRTTWLESTSQSVARHERDWIAREIGTIGRSVRRWRCRRCRTARERGRPRSSPSRSWDGRPPSSKSIRPWRKCPIARGERPQVTIGVSSLPRSNLMTRPIVFVAALVLIGTSAGVAQQKRVVTTADYDRAVHMLAPALNGLVVDDTVNVTWLPDGRFWYVRTTLTGTENVVVDPVKKTREMVATPPAGGQAAAGGGRPRRTRWRGGRGGRRRRRRDHQDVRRQRHGTDRSAGGVDVARRQQGALHLRLESLGARRRHRPGTPAHDRRRQGLRLRDEQRRLDDQRRRRRCRGRPTARRSRRSSRTSARSARCTSSRRRSTAAIRCCARGSIRSPAIRTSR